jgi:ribosome-associated translation inhibitor RaiA
MITVELHATDGLDRREVEAARREIARLDRYTRRSPDVAHLTLRPVRPGATNRYEADASLLVAGRMLAAHGFGRSPGEAAELAALQLRRQLRRIVGSRLALRNERLPRWPEIHPEVRRKPPGERAIVACRTYADRPLGTLEGVSDLIDDAEVFYLFPHARTREDVVVFWRDDARIGLLFPPGSALADEPDPVVPLASRYSSPLPLADACSEMDALDHRFLYFIAAEDERGKVLYLRRDGDYGLVVPRDR